MTRRLLIAAALAAAAMTTGCGVGPDKSREDATDTRDVDKSAAHVIAFNNHYPNVSTKCDGHGHRVFVSTGGVVIVMPDPGCPGYHPGVGFAASGASQPKAAGQ